MSEMGLADRQVRGSDAGIADIRRAEQAMAFFRPRSSLSETIIGMSANAKSGHSFSDRQARPGVIQCYVRKSV